MDIVKDSGLGFYVDMLAGQKDRLHEKALQFPNNIEQYLELPPLERLNVAANMLACYADISFHKKKFGEVPDEKSCATARLGTDVPHVAFDARVGYDRGQWRNALNTTYVDKHPTIQVWVNVQDVEKDIETGFHGLGEIEFGPYKIDDGTKHGKRIDEPHAVRAGRVLPLNDATSEQMITIIDEASCNLITGIITKHQRLGGLAVNGTTG